ncbi:glycosyltransferase family 2 protein [Duncaniella freteri]|uniref:glycosyltransferase family 2 protein n=1 Tax=Duncaniella freteri TaxID=2530391 RepID=UPI0025850D99|nr:glycosyltransferase family 2 protein [Duncaniella freteri]
MTETIKISIITVCYNAENTISKTIESVISQDYNHIEYIIIDGSSKDQTLCIINSYAGKISKVISEPDNGIYDAMNKGIEMATGDFIYFLGSGDYLIPNVIPAVIPQLSDTQSIYYGDVIFSPINKIYDGKFTKYKLAIRNICHQSMFFPTQFLKEHPYDLKYKAYSDWVSNIFFISKGFRFVYLNIIIAKYEIGGFSESGDNVFRKTQGQLIRKHLGCKAYLYYKFRNLITDIIKPFISHFNNNK